MIESIDGYLIGLEFSEEELQAISYRGFLYSGIGLMSVISLTFLALMIVN